MLTVGSLFSGIGGFDLGFERAGMRVAWQVERDPWARQVLATHWPEVPKYDDICTVHAGVVPRVDVLCGGFPCQDISLAGKGAGIAEGTRSGLWAEFARLVGELRPRYVVVENVSALRSRGLDRVLGDLAACGYDAEWDCIPACAVGAPHRRDRIWVVAYPQNTHGWWGAQQGPRGDRRPSVDGENGAVAHPRGSVSASADVAYPSHTGSSRPGRRDEPQGAFTLLGDGDPEDVADAHQPGLEGRIFHRERAGEQLAGTRRVALASHWRTEPHVGRVAHGVPLRVDRLRGLGNALVPQIATWIGAQILEDVRRQEGGVQ